MATKGLTMLSAFIERLLNLGITTTYIGNFPWIYLDTINGIKVKETYGANHGYHAFTALPNNTFKPYDRPHLFRTIRKYTTA